jgi:hypothetical protein
VAVTSIYNILITLLCIFGQKIAGAWNLWKPVQRATPSSAPDLARTGGRDQVGHAAGQIIGRCYFPWDARWALMTFAQDSGAGPASGLAASGDDRPEPTSATGRPGARAAP